MKSKDELFKEFTSHLMGDKTPSLYLNSQYNMGEINIFPFKMLLELKNTEQSLKHHPEGNVWNHTMMVVDKAALLRDKSKAPLSFMWAALLHDLGKPVVTNFKNGRITAYNHDRVGAGLAKEFLQELTSDFSFINNVEALVRWHMQLLFVVKDMPFKNIPAMVSEIDIEELALLCWCDRMGRTGASEALEKENIRKFIEICENYKKRVDNI